MIGDLLDHRCDIYHPVKAADSPGFGLPSSPIFSYPDKPDIQDLQCHFGYESFEYGLYQKTPMNTLTEKVKLTLPAGTDIRINDKIIDCCTGLEYTAGRPRNVRNHHVFVFIKRTKQQEAL